MQTSNIYKGNSKFEYEWVYSCPVCGGAGEFDIATRHREGDLNVILQIYACKDCDSSYHNPRMTDESLRDYYASGKYRTFFGRLDNPPAKESGARDRVNFLTNIMKSNPRRYLDVGCGQGYMVREVANRLDCEAVGYDMYEDPQAFIPVITDQEQVEGKFDLITCIHVLEHLRNPHEMLHWIASKLTDDGMVYLEVPQHRQLIIPHLIMFSRRSLPLLWKSMGLDGLLFILQPLNNAGILAKREPWNMDNWQERIKIVEGPPVEDKDHDPADYVLTEYIDERSYEQES